LQESFGFGVNNQRPNGGNGRLKAVGGHTPIAGFWAEYPWNPAEIWMSNGATGAETWAYSASTPDPNQAPSSLEVSSPGASLSFVSAPPATGHAASLLPFTAPPITYEVSVDVLPYPSFANNTLMAVGFTSSPALNANFENSGQAWMLIRFTDFNVSQGDMTVELHTNGMNGPSVSAQVFLAGWDTMTVRYDPVNQVVSGYYDGQLIGSVPYAAGPMSFVGFEGEGTLDNFVVKASN
jgi:hypothetical protein